MSMPRGKVTTISKARQMKVQDFGGDIEDAKPKKKSAKKTVANSNVLELVKQYRVIDEQEKELKKRKDALRTAIMELSKNDGQEDAIGNIYAKYDKFNVKHEMRKTIKLKNFEEVPEEFYEDNNISKEDISTSMIVLDESKIEQLIEDGTLDKDDVETFLLKISKSVALKITEDEKEDE